jgi:hypothetical protein
MGYYFKIISSQKEILECKCILDKPRDFEKMLKHNGIIGIETNLDDEEIGVISNIVKNIISDF